MGGKLHLAPLDKDRVQVRLIALARIAYLSEQRLIDVIPFRKPWILGLELVCEASANDVCMI